MAFDEARFRQVVTEALQIGAHQYQPSLSLGDIEEWDSVAHLELISAIETAFGLRFSADEMLELTGLEQLRSRLTRGA
jgi:acyl carrier protein